MSTSVAPPSPTLAATARTPKGGSKRDPRLDDGNVVLLRGTLRASPNIREWSSGSVTEATLITHSVVNGVITREVVPIVWDRAVATVVALGRVVVRGRVRQRFFRSAGATVSRTEVVVTELIPVSRRKTVQTTVTRATAELERLVGD